MLPCPVDPGRPSLRDKAVEHGLDLRSVGKEFSALLIRDERPFPDEFEVLLRQLAAREGGHMLSLLVETLDQPARLVIEERDGELFLRLRKP